MLYGLPEVHAVSVTGRSWDCKQMNADKFCWHVLHTDLIPQAGLGLIDRYNSSLFLYFPYDYNASPEITNNICLTDEIFISLDAEDDSLPQGPGDEVCVAGFA